MKIFTKFPFFILLFLFFQMGAVIAQESIDCLEKKLTTAQESEKAEIYNKIAKLSWYKKGKNFNILHNSKMALKYARRHKQIEQQSLALSNIGQAYKLKNKIKTAKRFANKALGIAKISGNDNALLQIYDLMANISNINNDYFGLLNSCKNSLAVFTRLNDKNKVALYTHVIGSYYLRLGDEKSWHEYIKKALKLYEEIGDDSHAIQMITYQAKDYLDFNEIERAEPFILQALERSKKINDYNLVCRTSLLVMEKSWLTNDIEGLNKCHEHMLSTASEIERTIQRNFWTLMAWEYLARGQNKLKLHNEAIQSLNTAIEYKFEDNEYKRSISKEIHYLMGEAYIGISSYNKAIEHFMESIQIITDNAEMDTSALRSLIKAYNKIAVTQIEMNNFKIAMQALKKGQKLIIDLKKKTIIADKKIIKEHHQLMARVLEKLGKHRKSQKYSNLSELL